MMTFLKAHDLCLKQKVFVRKKRDLTPKKQNAHDLHQKKVHAMYAKNKKEMQRTLFSAIELCFPPTRIVNPGPHVQHRPCETVPQCKLAVGSDTESMEHASGPAALLAAVRPPHDHRKSLGNRCPTTARFPEIGHWINCLSGHPSLPHKVMQHAEQEAF